MNVLKKNDFGQFFDALWGHQPFPWQTNLLEKIVQEGWPMMLDLPTGSGKTAALDIAVFALALDAARPPEERSHPRRIALVIDRRVVVDQGYKRAQHIAEKLRQSDHPILAIVRERLLSLLADPNDNDEPLQTAILRGGMPQDRDWAGRPDQPLIVVSTVDQVGSRLLFRGYGVSDGMKPIHAGLLGSDTLYLLDEVHLSRPFEQTLSAIERYRSSPLIQREIRIPGLQIVRMSATPGETLEVPFELDCADYAHPKLQQRLQAPKSAQLVSVNVTGAEEKRRQQLAKSCWSEAQKLLKTLDVVAVIVNRVDTAREVARLATHPDIQVRLLTGRMRPLDRQRIQESLLEHIEAGRTRTPQQGKLLLVSTQAIEAGADFDFDGLVTECASLDALRQRFGRVDRLGDFSKSQSIIIARNDQLKDNADPDPIYGEALKQTWKWLESLEYEIESDSIINDDQATLNLFDSPQTTSPEIAPSGIDFGITAMGTQLKNCDSSLLSTLLSPKLDAPVLLPAYLDMWAQTSPRPSVEPDISLFLHGPNRSSADVQIVWRKDIELKWLREAVAETNLAPEARVWTQALSAMLSICPPSSLEAMSVPIWAAKAWLQSIAASESGKHLEIDQPAVADIEGAQTTDETTDDNIAPVLRWLGAENSEVVGHSKFIKPGDTLVVLSSYGGIAPDSLNWDPRWRPDARLDGSTVITPADVTDLGDEAQLRHRAKVCLRWLAVEDNALLKVDAAAFEEYGESVEREVFTRWHSAQLSQGPVHSKWLELALEITTKPKRRIIRRILLPDEQGTIWRAVVTKKRIDPGKLRALFQNTETDFGGLTSENDLENFVGNEVELSAHLKTVRRFAHNFASATYLDETLKSDLELAAELHDLGKADPRFQLLLYGGDPVRMANGNVLAKSKNNNSHSHNTNTHANSNTGYPRGARHELMSVALVQDIPEFRDRAHDWEFVLHLIASHHGYCHPFAPAIAEREPVEVSISHEGLELKASSDHQLANFGSGISERFWRMVRRYGWHQLAYLEAVFRLADHRGSQFDAQNSGENS